jgi:predicted transcriptional regulator YdeE
MQTTSINQNITLACITAISFPAGVPQAHQEIQAMVPNSNQRRFYGISRPNEQGMIIYKAGIEIFDPNEAIALGLETFVIPSGTYQVIAVNDYLNNLGAIQAAFQVLTAHPDMDPEGYCIENYLNEKDLECWFKLK